MREKCENNHYISNVRIVTISLSPCVWMDSFRESICLTDHMVTPWAARHISSEPTHVFKVIAALKVLHWQQKQRGGERAAARMEAVMEFQWDNLPEVDGGESHWESKSWLLCAALQAPGLIRLWPQQTWLVWLDVPDTTSALHRIKLKCKLKSFLSWLLYHIGLERTNFKHFY